MIGWVILAIGQQNVTLQAINQQVSAGERSDVSMAWIGVIAVVLALGLLAMRWRRSVVTRKRGALNSPRKLVREVTRAAGMKRSEARALAREARALSERHGVEAYNPLLLLICPSLKRK